MSSRARFARFAEYRFDLDTGELDRGDRRTRLARQPARVLEVLIERRGELATRSELASAVWDQTTHVDYDQSLNYCVREIRRALGDSARRPRFVETLPKRGYRFLAPVTWQDGRTRDQPTANRRLVWPVAAIVLTALAAGALLGHELTVSPLHDRAVSWFHEVLGDDHW